MKFNYTDYNQHLAEITQQLNTSFAFATKKEKGVYTNTMPFVKCRDFFGDVLLAVETKTQQGIYGFYFNPKKQVFATDKCRMLIEFVSEESKEAFKANMKHYRKELEELTPACKYGRVWNLEAEKPMLLVVADPIWQQSVANISFYTFVLKVLSYPTLDKTKKFFDAVEELTIEGKDWEGKDIIKSTNESAYYKATKAVLPYFCKYLKVLSDKLTHVHGYKEPTVVSVVHNSAGFKALCLTKFGQIGERLKAHLKLEGVAV